MVKKPKLNIFLGWLLTMVNYISGLHNNTVIKVLESKFNISWVKYHGHYKTIITPEHESTPIDACSSSLEVLVHRGVRAIVNKHPPMHHPLDGCPRYYSVVDELHQPS
jgi:hypothetical protein